MYILQFHTKLYYIVISMLSYYYVMHNTNFFRTKPNNIVTYFLLGFSIDSPDPMIQGTPYLRLAGANVQI